MIYELNKVDLDWVPVMFKYVSARWDNASAGL